MSDPRPPDHPRTQLFRWWRGLFVMTILLCLLVSARYFAVTDFEASGAALLFRWSMLVGHLSWLCLLLLGPTLLLAWTWPRPRWVLTVGALSASIIILALLIDTQVYQLYRFHIDAGVLNLLFGGAARETFIFSGVMYVQAFLIAAGVVLVVTTIAVLVWRQILRTPAHPKITRVIAAVLASCFVGFHVSHMWADAIAYKPLIEQTAVLPLSHPATAKRWMRKFGVKVEAGSVLDASVRADNNTALAYPLQPLDCQAPVTPPNIIFILIDSWRFDAMSAQVTPRIAAFAPRAMQFADHYSGGNATRIGVFSLFYSIPGTYWHQMLREQRGPVFIEELLRQRFDLRVFRSAPLYSPEFDRTIFANVPSLRLRSEGDGPVAWDRDLTDDFLQFLEGGPRTTPFFALLFYDSPHSFAIPDANRLLFQPSTPHVNYLQLHAGVDEVPLHNRYRNSLHYVDSLVGDVLASVEQHGLLENTIVVITGDHGQEFNDSGRNYWGHASNFTRYQTSVPLLIYTPGRAGGVVKHRTTHFDVAPTLLRDHLGCTAEMSTFSVGQPLLEAGGRDPIVMSEYTDFAIVQPEKIAVVRKQGMQMVDREYAEIDGTLEPAALQSALEQRTRFFRSARRRQPPTAGTSVSGGE